jgi:hypothetical protein
MRDFAGAPVVLLLAHARHEHVFTAVTALQSAQGFEGHRFVAVIDGNWPKTVRVIRSVAQPVVLVETHHGDNLFPRNRILKNLQVGLSIAFDVLGAPYCVVVEDDIVVSTDFLNFVASAYNLFHLDARFRAVNGFSCLEPSSTNTPDNYTRVNYGVGWGWALPHKSYRRIKGLLLREEDNHWDSLIEPYLRTGFVITPGRSRVENIGFDGTGAHSGSLADTRLGDQMRRSKLRDGEWRSSPENLRKVAKSIQWREDAISLDSLSFLLRHSVYATGNLLNWLSATIYWVEQRGNFGIGRRLRRAEKYIKKRVLPAFASLAAARD